jgi:signal transduction histidine kinase
MLNLNNIINKYMYLRNSSAIPFFYEKITVLPRAFNNVIHFMSLGRMANGVFHDLMNPLTSLLLSIETKNVNQLQEVTKSSKELSEFVRVIQTQLKNNLTYESFSISKLIDDSLILIKYKALINNIRIITVKDSDFTLFGNKLILMRAILNLINNAIESYDKCPQDQQDVIVSIYKKEEFLNISIKDFGCGISKNNQRKIFRYFYTNKSNGTGIGLATAYRSIRKEYFGRIIIESDTGSGSNFIIKIPLKVSV